MCMFRSVSMFKPSFTSAMKQDKKPITRGLDYSTDALANAEPKNSAEAYVLKRIPTTINHVDEFIKTSGKEFSEQDREDMIQEAILANLEKTKQPNYSQMRNRAATHTSAEKHALNQSQKQINKQDLVEPITQIESEPTCTIEDNLAQSSGFENASDLISDVLSKVSPRSEMIIRERYGFDGKCATQKEIAKQFKVSTSAAHEYERKAHWNLRRDGKDRMLSNQIHEAPNGGIYSFNASIEEVKNGRFDKFNFRYRPARANADNANEPNTCFINNMNNILDSEYVDGVYKPKVSESPSDSEENDVSKTESKESDGTIIQYGKNGLPERKIFPDGMELRYNEEGKIVLCVSPSGLTFGVDASGYIVET